MSKTNVISYGAIQQLSLYCHIASEWSVIPLIPKGPKNPPYTRNEETLPRQNLKNTQNQAAAKSYSGWPRELGATYKY